MYAIDYLSSHNSTKVTGPTPPLLTEITPDDARKMLQRSAEFCNRAVKKSALKEYTESIKNGKWRYEVADPIRIDTNGFVIDGQHRLLAVIDANTPMLFYVVSNLPTDAANYIDIGVPRTHADFVALGGNKNAPNVAAAIRFHARYVAGSLSNNTVAVPRHAVNEYLAKHPGLLRSVELAVKGRDVLRRTGVSAACHYIFSQFDEKMADTFFEKLRTGLDLAADDPIYLLRQRLIDPWRKLNDVELGAVLIKTWNYTRLGTKVSRIAWYVTRGEEFPKAI